MERQIVVAFRMPPAGLAPGPEGPYLVRARSMCARGEALGGRLVAWSAALLAMAWETDAIEEALELATSLREESSAPERAWTCGVAEGELESLAQDGQRMHLAWGEALVSAAGLARVAKAGEVLVDGDVRALRSGQLALIGARSATDAGQRVRGWRLDLDRPWKRGAPGSEASERAPALESVPASTRPTQAEARLEAAPVAPRADAPAAPGVPAAAAAPAAPAAGVRPDAPDREAPSAPQAVSARAPAPAPQARPALSDLDSIRDLLESRPDPTDLDAIQDLLEASEGSEERDETMVVTAEDLEIVHPDRDPTQPMPALDADDFDDELSTADVLQVIEASALQPFDEEPSTSARRREGTLADRVRALSHHDKNRDPVVAIADLRRARARAEGAAPTVRCQAALALAMTLSIAGRVEEALLEALDALSSARVAGDPRAINACVALLAKLYTGAGFPDAARTLRETVEGAPTSGA